MSTNNIFAQNWKKRAKYYLISTFFKMRGMALHQINKIKAFMDNYI
jgi:hypothetical protein